MKTSSASSVLILAMKLNGGFVLASDILRERQGRNTGGPSAVTHSEVSLRPVIERLCVHTGRLTRFVYDKAAPLSVPPMIPDPPEVRISDESLFRRETIELFERMTKHYAFTLTEEEYDHERYQDDEG